MTRFIHCLFEYPVGSGEMLYAIEVPSHIPLLYCQFAILGEDVHDFCCDFEFPAWNGSKEINVKLLHADGPLFTAEIDKSLRIEFTAKVPIRDLQYKGRYHLDRGSKVARLLKPKASRELDQLFQDRGYYFFGYGPFPVPK